MKTFKLRAECLEDIHNFLKFINNSHISEFIISQKLNSDIELEFKSVLLLKEIIEILKNIPDSHVMVQTVSELEFYNGIRNYALV